MAGVECGKLDLTKLPLDEIIHINDAAWIRAEVDEKIYFIGNRLYAVIKFGDMCEATPCNDQANLKPELANLVSDGDSSYYRNTANPPDEGKATSLSQGVNESNQNGQNIQVAQGAVDANAINALSWTPAAVAPAAAVIPMKSNIATYGPYASNNFGSSCGGTQVEINSDLCPWVYGSVQAMNTAGRSIVESSAIGLVKSETGSVTVPGMPALGNLGMALGGAGPTLSSINFSYGSQGISTNYEFRTYTPKFGSLNRHLLDKVKDITRNRNEQIKFLRNNQITQNKISRKLKATNPPRVQKNNGGTLQRVLVGEIYDWYKVGKDQTNNDLYGQTTVVGISTLRKSVEEMTFNYAKKAYVSLDALYGPVSISGDGGLPRYTSFAPDGHKSSPVSPMPPFSVTGDCSTRSIVHEQYNTNITQKYVNPLTNKFGENEHHHKGSGVGHSIDLIGRGDTVPQEGLINSLYSSADDEQKYAKDYRFLGMRGPIVLHSWGYDLDGKPIPNEADTDSDTSTGKFQKESLKDRFLPNWLQKPATWPAAPIDLRFDRERGLWVSPQSYKIVVAKIVEPVECFGEGKGVVIPYGKQLFDREGVKINPIINEEKCDSEAIKEYEWIVISLGSCNPDQYYCCPKNNGTEFFCVRSDEASFCGRSNATAGPFDTLAECPCDKDSSSSSSSSSISSSSSSSRRRRR